jgi:hypothetical protein
MQARAPRWLSTVGLATLAACGGGGDGIVAPDPNLGIGQSLQVSGAQTFQLQADASGGQYVAVLVNTSLTASGAESFTLRGSGLTAPSPDLLSAGAATLARLAAPGSGPADAPMLDRAFEARLRARERAELTPRIAAARAWYARSIAPSAGTGSAASGTSTVLSPTARRNSALPASVNVGDTVTVNVNAIQACSSPLYHQAVVVAIGTRALILNDTQNPSGGFTSADFQAYAARFDTLVYPLDVNAFGQPTDLDHNGHIAIIFTEEVNKLTQRGSLVYTGGFTQTRDLFPLTTTGNLSGCPGSNQGEFFYLLTPDPLGQFGPARSTSFVDANTKAVVAHEFQHLINGSRRLYVNNAATFEATWLDEGLAHIAEELLFYHEAGLSPRSNLDASVTGSTAYTLDMKPNKERYSEYLANPSHTSPYANNDTLSTRGAAWDLLRYLADRNGPTDGDVFFRLVNSTDSGTVNVRAVFGDDFANKVRDWSVSHAADDVTTVAEYQQPSWNFHSIFGGAYPLPVQVMADGSTYSNAVVPGGAAFYRLAVPAGGLATITLGGQSSAASKIQVVVVRTR